MGLFAAWHLVDHSLPSDRLSNSPQARQNTMHGDSSQVLGHSGTIYTEHTLQGMEMLGISKQCAERCAQKIHIDAIKQLHSIVKTRRYLEHLGAPKAGQLPGNQQSNQRDPKRQKQNLRPP